MHLPCHQGILVRPNCGPTGREIARKGIGTNSHCTRSIVAVCVILITFAPRCDHAQEEPGRTLRAREQIGN